ncbi:MAG TPA: sigma factor, partial [Vicinamibacterales bacterium]|nr:sigma factor [Vicinamibacterales bacterium]
MAISAASAVAGNVLQNRNTLTVKSFPLPAFLQTHFLLLSSCFRLSPGTNRPNPANMCVHEDALLLAAAAGGDAEAFAALYRRRRPDVFRFALHVTGDAAAAEDVVQETFMTVIRHAGRYDPARAAVVPWLLGIARNHARRRDRRPFDPLPDDRAGGLPGGGADPAAALVRDEDVAR